MATRKALKKPGPAAKKEPPSLFADMQKELKHRLASGKDGVVEVLTLSDENVLGRVKGIIPSGSDVLNHALGHDGWSRGRVVEIYGPEHSGKTTVALMATASCQKCTSPSGKNPGLAAYCDAESKLDAEYALALGNDLSKLLIFQPEEGGTKIEHMRRSLREFLDSYEKLTEDMEPEDKPPSIFVVDSIAAHGTHVEEGRTMEPGVPARQIREAMRELSTRIARVGCCVIVLNWTYAKIGGYGGNTSYGGGGLKFASTYRIDMKRTGRLALPDGRTIGIEGKLKVEKNSLGNFAELDYAVAYKRGLVDAYTIFEKLKQAGYITVSGGWTAFQTQGSAPLKWQGGWARLSQMFDESPDLRNALVTLYKALP
jgi:recombination protein RecA